MSVIGKLAGIGTQLNCYRIAVLRRSCRDITIMQGHYYLGTLLRIKNMKI